MNDAKGRLGSPELFCNACGRGDGSHRDICPTRAYGPTGAAAEESREDIAAPGGATTGGHPPLEERVRLLEDGIMGPGQLVPRLWLRVDALEAALGLGTKPAPEATRDERPCGCEQSDALQKQLEALRARNFDLSVQLSRIRKLARSPEVRDLFEEIDREP
jgi:hypothetical protein